MMLKRKVQFTKRYSIDSISQRQHADNNIGNLICQAPMPETGNFHRCLTFETKYSIVRT